MSEKTETKKESMFLAVMKELRIKGWLKNLLVLCPIVFSLELLEWERLSGALLLMLAFCFVSSGVYVLNDIVDLKNDRNHPIKKNRPIASGRIPVGAGWAMVAVFMCLGLGIAFFVNKVAFFLILAYILINVLYSKWLKKMPVIDCFCIAAGFLIRVLAGGTVVTDGVSDWMFLTVVAMSLFMAFGKRRGELSAHGDSGTRDVLGSYDMGFLTGVVCMNACLMVVFYSLWSIQKEKLIYTVPVVLFIVIRYLLLIFKGKSEGDPTTVILSDKVLLISGVIYALIILAILYIV